MPESITSWIISGFSLDPINGLGLTKESKRVQVFQPFIISLDLPFSVKRGEIISIPVAVFNNLDEDLEVEVTLHNTDQELEFVKMENEVESPSKTVKKHQGCKKYRSTRRDAKMTERYRQNIANTYTFR